MDCSSKSERAQTKNIMETAHPRGGGGGVASHPIHPLDQPLASPKAVFDSLKGDLCIHALHNEAGCLNHRVVTMVADKLKRQQLRGSN